MHSLNKYWHALNKEFLRRREASLIAGQKEFAESVLADIFDEKQPNFKPLPLSEEDRFIGEILKGVLEVVSSRECLCDIKEYIRYFPKKGQISKSRFLAYHFENYYHEVYILRERLKSHVNVLGKFYQRAPNPKVLPSFGKNFEKGINQVFKDFLEPRRRHVHESRVKEKDISRLSSMELYMLMPELGDIVKWIYPREVRKTRKKLIAAFDQSNAFIERTLEVVFKALYEMVFTKDGLVDFPKKVAG